MPRVVVSGDGEGVVGVRGEGRARVGSYRRVRGEYTALGYETTAVMVRDGLVSQVGVTDSVSEFYDRRRLVAQSRKLVERCEVYEGLVGRSEAYAVGSGFALSVVLKDRKLAEKVEARWNAWAGDKYACDVRGVLDFGGLLAAAFREHVIAGDVVGLKVREGNEEGKVQLLESEQLFHKKHASGIEVSALGRPVRYWLCPYKNGRLVESLAAGYAPEDVLFLTAPKRPSHLRTRPLLQSAFPTLLRISDVCDSEALARQLQSKMALSVTQKEGSASGYANSAADPSGSGTPMDLRVTELDSAMIFFGNPGDEVKPVERTAPGADFEKEMRMFLRLIGLPIGLPLELILLDWSGANYSVSRAILEQAFQQFRKFQQLLSGGFCSPVFEWKVREWVARKELPPKALEAVRAHTWITPSFPWIDQLKETEAQGAKVDRGFALHGDVLRSMGRDRGEFLVSRESEVRDAIEIAKRVSAETGEEVSWKLFAGLQEGKTEAAMGKGEEAGGETGKREEN